MKKKSLGWLILSALICAIGVPGFMIPASAMPIPDGNGRQLADLLRADEVTPDEMGFVATAFGTDQFYVTNQNLFVVGGDKLQIMSNVTMFDSEHRTFGDMVFPGDIVSKGLVWNRSDQPAEFAYIVGDRTAGSLILQAGQMISVGSFINMEPIAEPGGGGGGGIISGGPQNCHVTCGSGFYACCNFQNTGYPTCKCVSVTAGPSTCNGAGGPGATSCSLIQSPSAPAPGVVQQQPPKKAIGVFDAPFYQE